MNPETIRVSLAFARAADRLVEGTANTILTKLFPIPEYSNPPVSEGELQGGTTDLTTALADQVNGGKLGTARKNAARKVVVDMLKKLAYFVQIQCNNDMALLLSSGFDAVSSNRTRVQLPQPVIIRIDNGMSGQTVLAADPNSNARSWQAEHALIAGDGSYGPWISVAPGTDSRRILAENLIPGQMYGFRLRSVGGTTGCSDWSNTVTHRAA